MSAKLEAFLRLCIEELDITNKTLLGDIAYAYERWQEAPRFPRYEGEGFRAAWIGPVQPGGYPQPNRWEPLTQMPLYGFVEDMRGRQFAFCFNEKRLFEELDFQTILKHLARETDLADKDVGPYFHKMYRMQLAPADFPLDPARAPFDWDDAALWNLRYIIKGTDMESPQKKGVFQHVREELQAEWAALQQAVQAHWDPKILALLRLDDSASCRDYPAFSRLIAQAGAPAARSLIRHPWAIGVLNGKSALTERERFQLLKAVQDGKALEDALQDVLGLGPDDLKALAGKKLGQLPENDPRPQKEEPEA